MPTEVIARAPCRVRRSGSAEPNLSKEVIESCIPEKVWELAAIHHFRRSDFAPFVAEAVSLAHDVLASKRENKAKDKSRTTESE
jgi:hypothetical protein